MRILDRGCKPTDDKPEKGALPGAPFFVAARYTCVAFVALDRIEDVARPDYCIHGRATCAACGTWCWLGSETHARVVAGALTPVCLPCVRRYAVPGTHAGTIDDHRRADGPHP